MFKHSFIVVFVGGGGATGSGIGHHYESNIFEAYEIVRTAWILDNINCSICRHACVCVFELSESGEMMDEKSTSHTVTATQSTIYNGPLWLVTECVCILLRLIGYKNRSIYTWYYDWTNEINNKWITFIFRMWTKNIHTQTETNDSKYVTKVKIFIMLADRFNCVCFESI